ncbi:uncharacterized protein LDX57_004311 [Aspergillus melleus]|uniref:uncharacterized protein n=1 Tax=Aspergillus melleus TaxID=138277 RepID=UPI001E8E2CFD|nr:uncharacterized protein LDX57_004311 [Aspergillus melleus]KAH8426574.1 hypothetical protein LDX57_004311 [Aspergillus melleus]
MKQFTFLLATIQLASSSSADETTCYRPNGRRSPNHDAKKCNGVEGAVSMCCAQSDECLKNGLCKVAGDKPSNTSAIYWRDTCSLSSWPDVGCLKVCADGDLESENTQMTPCDGTDYSEKWCCGITADCCGTKDEVSVPRNIYISTSLTNGLSTSTSTQTSAHSQTRFTSARADPTSSLSSSQSSKPESSSDLSTGGKAGIGVGVAVGAIAVIGLLTFFLRRKHKSKHPALTVPMMYVTSSCDARELDAASVYEKPAGAEDSRHELPGDSAPTVTRR